MDKNRAKKIAASPVMANVTYEGTPIYIESVNEQNETATIHPVNQPENNQEVFIESLIEH